jgi:hypothetical protein
MTELEEELDEILKRDDKVLKVAGYVDILKQIPS